MFKTIKVLFLIFITLAYINFVFFMDKGFVYYFSKTDFYYDFIGETINVKEMINQYPSLYETYDEQKIVELRIPKSKELSNKYTQLRGFDYIAKLKDINSLVYSFEYIPKNFNKTLKKMNNLRWLEYESYLYSTDKEYSVEHLEDLNIEHFKGVFKGFKNASVINTYKNLKTASLYNILTETFNQREFYISNHNLEKLYFYIKVEQDNKDDVDIVMDVKNLNELIIQTDEFYSVNVKFENNEAIKLDNLEFYKCDETKLISDKKIQSKKISLTNVYFKNTYISDIFNCVDLESVKKFSITYCYGNNKDEIVNDQNLKQVNKLVNLYDLNITSTQVKNLNFIDQMPSVRNLYMELSNGYKDIHANYDLTNIKNLENVEHVILKLENSNKKATIIGLEQLSSLKNLKTLVVNYEISHMLPQLDGIEIIIE